MGSCSSLNLENNCLVQVQYLYLYYTVGSRSFKSSGMMEKKFFWRKIEGKNVLVIVGSTICEDYKTFLKLKPLRIHFMDLRTA